MRGKRNTTVMVTVVCEWCSQSVTVPHRPTRPQRFCSKTCANYARWSVQSPESAKQFICEECGVVAFVKEPGRLRTRRFCSKSCATRFTRRLHPPAPRRTFQCEWCGETRIDTRSQSKRFRRFCNRSCMAQAKMGVRSQLPPNRAPTVTRGYRYLYRPDHPGANTYGYVAEHRLVVEGVLGRRLRSDEVVHHRNEQPGDNRPENLQVMNRREHSRIHRLGHFKE